MGFFLLLLLISVAKSLSQNYCWSYKCKTNTTNLNTNTCLYPDFMLSTYFLNPCELSSTYCPTFSSSTNNATCTAINPILALNSYPGEPCIQTSDCAYGSCTLNKCVGLPIGSSCTSHAQCDANLRCANKVCTGLIDTLKTGCTSDYDCYPDSGCNITGTLGTCLKYFSQSNGAYVSNCTRAKQGGTSFLCGTNVCLKRSFFNDIGVCVDAPMSLNRHPILCETEYDCPGKSLSNNFYSDCTCGLNEFGNSYCEPMYGDSQYLAYLSALKSFVNVTNLGKCNTVRRFSEEC